jgi:hypothetical protein
MSSYVMYSRYGGEANGLDAAFPVRNSPAIAFAQKNLAAVDVVYVTMKIALSAGAFTFFDAHSAACYLGALTDGGSMLAGVARFSGAWRDFLALGPTNPSVAFNPDPDTWFIAEFHFIRDSERGIQMHCAPGEASGGRNLPAMQLRVGQYGSEDPGNDGDVGNAWEVYVAHVKAGTTRWGNYLFEDDFASGDFSAWDYHMPWIEEGGGGTKIIPNPGFPPYSDTCNPFVERAGVHLAPITIPYGNVPVRLG